MDPWRLTLQMLHDLPRNGRHSVVVSIKDEDEEGHEVTITPTADPSKFEVEVMPPFLDEEEEPQTMSAGDIVRLLQRYDVAEVARIGMGENAVRFRRSRQNLLGRGESSPRAREEVRSQASAVS